MSNGLRALVRLVVAVAMAFSTTAGFAQERYGLSDEAYGLFNRWLRSSCIGDEERALTEGLFRYRATLAPAFEKAIADGPPADELRAARMAAEARYAERAKFTLDEYRIEGVGKEDLARFQRVSRDEYVDDQVRRFAVGYRSNAVAGLGIVDGPGSRALLARIAADKDNPLALAAAEALKSMRSR
jgi:hypothetical protein